MAQNKGCGAMKKIRVITLTFITTLLWTASVCIGAWVVTKGDRVYIEDRTGERWDVTQSQELGFNPHRFQYGIGKDAFTPLGDDDFEKEKVSNFFNQRIIGISIDNNAHAYAVKRLRNHEIANTTIAGKAIVAGY